MGMPVEWTRTASCGCMEDVTRAVEIALLCMCTIEVGPDTLPCAPPDTKAPSIPPESNEWEEVETTGDAPPARTDHPMAMCAG